ncbi:NAD-dependent epimerase/dehydratase family protein [Streptomyces sp. NPDC059474]|uniref:NAD-dependent epimerase/dehydratase family protein n=1 Tax=Streptomyces sp. NPDC059474 TaxID=3346846 RepID=UPI00367F75B5
MAPPFLGNVDDGSNGQILDPRIADHVPHGYGAESNDGAAHGGPPSSIRPSARETHTNACGAREKRDASTIFKCRPRECQPAAITYGLAFRLRRNVSKSRNRHAENNSPQRISHWGRVMKAIPVGPTRTPVAEPVSVIGGSGFIGANLRKNLESAGVRVHSFTRRRPFAQGGRLHRPVLRSSTIFYVAGSLTPARAEQAPRLVAQDYWNLQLLLWGLRGTAHRPLVVLASSGGTVYDPAAAPPYHEDAPTRAASAYGAAKLEQEHALATAEWTTPVVLRLANVYGPGQRARPGYGVIPHWVRAVREQETLTMIGQSRRDYVHVNDACAAMLAVHRHADRLRAVPGVTTLNIGSGEPTSLEELHRHLEHAAGHRLAVRREPARSFDRTDVWLDVRSAGAVLGWTSKTGLVEGLMDTLAAVESARTPS